MPNLPLQTIAEFDEWEVYLLEEVNFNDTAAYLSAGGAQNVDANVKNTCKHIMTNQLASLFNWKGSGRKKKHLKQPRLLA